MDNYKIKVNDEAESKEAQELFFELGGQWKDSGKVILEYDPSMPFFYLDGEILHKGSSIHNYQVCDRKELTLPQLRDLVVLKRNDVKDKTHRDKRDESIYLTSDKVIYYWQGEWCKSAINKSNDYENYIANSLTPIAKPQDPALISGADALRALADGKEVEYFSPEYSKEWKSIRELTTGFDIGHFLNDDHEDDDYKFRLKPQTIKLEIELPKPFEPKEGDIYWFLSPFYSTGYDHCTFANDSSDKLHVQYGAYRSEDDVKKAVEQLRKIRGTNS